VPRSDPAGSTGGSAPSGSPVQARRSGAQSLVASSSQPVREARLRSAPRVPASRYATQSAALSTVATRDSSRPAPASARTLAALARPDTGSPVRLENTSAPTVRPRSAASGPPRVSCQATSGASGRPPASSSTTLSAKDARPTARTCAPGRASHASRSAPRTTSASRSGSISAPVDVVVHGTGAWASGRVTPSPAGEPSASRSSTPTLAPVVPRSRPSTTSVTGRPPGRCRPGRLRTGRLPAGRLGTGRRVSGRLLARHQPDGELGGQGLPRLQQRGPAGGAAVGAEQRGGRRLDRERPAAPGRPHPLVQPRHRRRGPREDRGDVPGRRRDDDRGDAVHGGHAPVLEHRLGGTVAGLGQRRGVGHVRDRFARVDLLRPAADPAARHDQRGAEVDVVEQREGHRREAGVLHDVAQHEHGRVGAGLHGARDDDPAAEQRDVLDGPADAHDGAAPVPDALGPDVGGRQVAVAPVQAGVPARGADAVRAARGHQAAAEPVDPVAAAGGVQRRAAADRRGPRQRGAPVPGGPDVEPAVRQQLHVDAPHHAHVEDPPDACGQRVVQLADHGHTGGPGDQAGVEQLARGGCRLR
jgi:hypothetical protein